MTEELRLTLKVITPDREVLETEVAYAVLPATDGYIGILPRHIPLVTTLRPGIVSYRVKRNEDKQVVAVGEGFAEVSGEGISVLCDSAETPDEIDVERAREALGRAERRLERKPEGVDAVRARAALERAIARLRVAGELHDNVDIS